MVDDEESEIRKPVEEQGITEISDDDLERLSLGDLSADQPSPNPWAYLKESPDRPSPNPWAHLKASPNQPSPNPWAHLKDQARGPSPNPWAMLKATPIESSPNPWASLEPVPSRPADYSIFDTSAGVLRVNRLSGETHILNGEVGNFQWTPVIAQDQ